MSRRSSSAAVAVLASLALAAPAVLLVLSGIAAEVVTPFVLGRGLLLNPVAIFIAILLWGWLWGVAGALLAGILLLYAVSRPRAGSTKPGRQD